MRLSAYRLTCVALVAGIFSGAALSDNLSPSAGTNTSSPVQGASAPGVDPGVEHLITEIESCKPVKVENIKGAKFARRPEFAASEFYPYDELKHGKQAKLLMKVYVDQWGNPRFAHTLAAFPRVQPAPDFLDGALKLVNRIRFVPATVNGKATGTWDTMPINFYDADVAGPMGRLLQQDKWVALLDRANGGDRSSIMLSSYIAQLVGGESGLTDRATLNLFANSAFQGSDFDRLRIVRMFSGCGKGSMVEPWLVDVANAGSPEAKLLWAEELIDIGDDNLAAKAKALLEEVAGAQDPFLQLWAAGMLATAPVDAIRDPTFALRAAEKLNATTEFAMDPDYRELLAAALAANGQFAKAAKSEREAISRAEVLDWDTAPLKARLTSYESGKQWRGYLCDCDALSAKEY